MFFVLLLVSFIKKFPTFDQATEIIKTSAARRKTKLKNLSKDTGAFEPISDSLSQSAATGRKSNQKSRGNQLVNAAKTPGITFSDKPTRYSPLIMTDSSSPSTGYSGSRPGQQTLSSLNNGKSLFQPSTNLMSSASTREQSDWNAAHRAFEQRRAAVTSSSSSLVSSINSSSMNAINSINGHRTSHDSMLDEEESELNFDSSSKSSYSSSFSSSKLSAYFKPSSYTWNSHSSSQTSTSSYARPISPAPFALVVSRGELKGMKNVGNTCYMNAILQALFAQSSFVHDLNKTYNNSITPKNKFSPSLPAPITDGSFYSCLATIALERRKANHGVIDTAKLKSVFESKLTQFAGYNQQDAHEFLTECLNHINVDILEVFERQWKNKHREMEKQNSLHDVNGIIDKHADNSNLINNQDDPIIINNSIEVDTQPVINDDNDFDRVALGIQNGSGSDKENESSAAPIKSSTPRPPIELVREWETICSELSPVQSNFHCAVKVTLTCAKCSHERSNIEHFTVLSLDLMKEPSKQTTLDSFIKTDNPVSESRDNPNNNDSNTRVPAYLRVKPEANSSSSTSSSSSFSSSSNSRSSHSLDDLLREFFKPTEREYRCEKCSHDYVKIQSQIVQLPRVLILHVKRFTANKFGTIEKLTDRVTAKKTLNIEFACDSQVKPPIMEEETDNKSNLVSNNEASQTSNHLPSNTEKSALSPLSSSSKIPSPITLNNSPLSSKDQRQNYSNQKTPNGTKRKPDEFDDQNQNHEQFHTPSSSLSNNEKNKRIKLASPLDVNVSNFDSSVEILSTPPTRPRNQFTFGSSLTEHDRWSRDLDAEKKYHEIRMKKIHDRYKDKNENLSDIDYALQLSAEESRNQSKKEEIENQMREAKEKQKLQIEEKRKLETEKAEKLKLKLNFSPTIKIRNENNFEEVNNDDDANGMDEELLAVMERSKKEISGNSVDEEFERQLKEATEASMKESELSNLDENDPDLQILLNTEENSQSDEENFHFDLKEPNPSTPTTTSSTGNQDNMKNTNNNNNHNNNNSIANGISSSSPPSAVYNLSSVVLHRGYFSSSGHYVTDVRELDQNKKPIWRHYDDQFVRTQTDETSMMNKWASEGYIFFFKYQQQNESTSAKSPV